MYRLEGTTAVIAVKLSDARINAIKRNRPVWMEITFSDRQARVQTIDPVMPGYNIDVSDPVFLSNELNFDDSGGTGLWRLTFDSVGRPTAPSTLTLIGPSTGNRFDIAVSATGRIRTGPQ